MMINEAEIYIFCCIYLFPQILCQIKDGQKLFMEEGQVKGQRKFWDGN